LAWLLQKLACFLTLSSPRCRPLTPLVCPSFSWSERFQYFQLIFGARLIHNPDGGDSTHSWNVGLLQRDNTALYPRKLPFSCSHTRDPEISHRNFLFYFNWSLFLLFFALIPFVFIC
jgi:hypothetical protein